MLIYAIVLIVMMILNWAPAVLEFRERHGIRTYLAKLKKPKEEK
jgi:branched-chain amino acid transport system permease protein